MTRARKHAFRVEDAHLFQKHEHTCAHHDAFDPETFEPLGPACGKPAMQELYWQDGRVSPSCSEHGMAALDDDARALVVRVVVPTCEDDWATDE